MQLAKLNKADSHLLTRKDVQDIVTKKKQKKKPSMLNMSSFWFKTTLITNHLNINEKN